MDRLLSSTLPRPPRVKNSIRDLPVADFEPYPYAPLEDLSTEIRLVTILPGANHDPISIEISHAKLPQYSGAVEATISLSEVRQSLPPGWQAFKTPEDEFIFCNRESRWHRSSWVHPIFEHNRLLHQSLLRDCQDSGLSPGLPDYEAISYTWGDDKNSEVVFVEGCALNTSAGRVGLHIHRNLAWALRHLRYERLPRVMWVDALCINQDDVIERGRQVQRMADIYRQASRVVVWLGPEGNNSDLAISTLSYISSQVEITKDSFTLPSPSATERSWYDYDTELPYSYKTWEAISNLARRDWFDRLWIVQEIQMANRRAMLVCGDSSILWSQFRRCIVALIGRKGLDLSQHNSLVKLQGLCIGSTNLTISGVIEEHFNRCCADPRDKIYGMLGILPQDFTRQVVPQYTLSPSQVFRDVLLAHIDYTDRLEFLRFCGLRPQRTALESPTWIIESTDNLLRFPISQFASGYSRAAVHYTAPNILEVLGVKAATITSVSEPSSDTYKDCVSAISDWEPANMRQRKYITGESMLDAFAITISGFLLRDRIPEVHAPYLSSWRDFDWEAVLLACLADSGPDMSPIFATNILTALMRRRFFSTAEGYIGLAPSQTQTGDILAVMLGCASPIVLRATSSGKYNVIGESFTYGLNDAMALLGPLPDGWVVQAFTDASGYTYDHRFVHAETRVVSDDDPRLEPLTGWKRARRDKTNRDPELFQWYRNEATGEEMNSDPRLLPGALRKRGIPLESFGLV